MKRVGCLLGMMFLSSMALAQRATIFDEPQSDHRVAYTLHATLDTEERTVRGTQRVTWRNPDTVEVDTVQFHLYLNAFRDKNSTFMRESGGVHRGFVAGESTGEIRMEHLKMISGDNSVDLTNHITFIQPDDGNVHDRTVAQVVLPEPVAPGDILELDILFEAKLPPIVARTGWEQKEDGTLFFMVAQWFPKLGVYEIPGQRFVPADAPRGRWNTHQFHANSEFYADFGTFDVTIDVPENFLVGATGVRTAERVTEGRRELVYHATDVHDFAWTASPAFVAFTDTWRHVNLRLLLQPEHQSQAERHFDAAKIALEHTDELLGVYPYTTLTLIDGLGNSNGMEYPTLITCGTAYGLPSWIRMPELVIIHEFAHQYFYGMLASNEFEEAWLDEGMTTYMETRIMDEAYGPGSVVRFPGLYLDDGPSQRIFYTQSTPGRGALFTKSWEYEQRADYGKTSYAKASTVMHTLAGYLGEDKMRQFLQTYYERWRFRHPATHDLQEVAEEIAEENLDWFFEQYVYGTAVVDYAVDTLEVTQRGENFTSVVRIGKQADGIMPQTLEVLFEDGVTQRVTWDGESMEHSFTFEHSAPVTEARIDPDNIVWLDINQLNNRKTRQPSPVFAIKYLSKISAWMQQLLSQLGVLF